MRIDKLLANMNYGSRKEVKKLLKNGIVTVNGDIIKDAKYQVNPNNDKIFVQGEEVVYIEFVYFIMNKPKGVISATVDARDETVLDLLHPDDAFFQPAPVGRLDKDTEGLLLLTNDGQLTHNLLSPKKHVAKTYYAIVDGKVTEDDIVAFKDGVSLDDGYVTMPAELKILTAASTSEIELTIMEGKFHQVKRMFKAVGKKVTYLKRIKMGNLVLDPTLELGDYRSLTEDELQLIQQK